MSNLIDVVSNFIGKQHLRQKKTIVSNHTIVLCRGWCFTPLVHIG